MKQKQKNYEKILKNQFDFNDFLSQLQQIKKMGNVKDLMGMLGMGKAMKGADIPMMLLKALKPLFIP